LAAEELDKADLTVANSFDYFSGFLNSYALLNLQPMPNLNAFFYIFL
jgi:hypothetical protein